MQGKQVVGNGTDLIMDATLGVGSLPLLEDILDIVIGNLCDDKTSLSEISLASKSLMVLARRHLFRTITVQGVSRTHGFSDFNDHLSSSQQTSHFIQDVSLVGRVSGCSIFQPSLDYHLLGQILSNLPLLRRLKLDNITWRGKIDQDRDDSRIHEYSPTPLDNLSITSSCVEAGPEGFTGRQHLLDLMTLFSTIDTLRLSYLDIAGPGPGTNSPECQKMETPSYVRVRSFVSEGNMDPCILETIRNSGSLDSLKVVSLHWYEWDGLVAVGAFLRGIGQGIQDLCFAPEDTFWQSEEMCNHQYRDHSNGL
ncbi:hypothetical protein NLI96_g618 [Meripilus lineatus]|uniref:Uncharacterized protein n=1 Tax=Meripilus lineatus TaxID=2056292 RepID=A0AAD5VC24_9APHY|nr:hypothetical protein NLI96_g618 [Physisporinus lineatus]